jgi:hypothetical protein
MMGKGPGRIGITIPLLRSLVEHEQHFGEEILRGLQPFTAFSEHPESSRYRLIAQLVTPDYVANPATATHADILFKVDGADDCRWRLRRPSWS